jgi:hydroxymethylpyrimidine/phosphomethylpyrimidine kinase
MGHVVPDRLFWAESDDEPEEGEDGGTPSDSSSSFEFPPHDTQH